MFAPESGYPAAKGGPTLKAIVVNSSGKVRNGWWVGAFFLALGVAVVCLVGAAPQGKVPDWQQLAAVVAVTWLLQRARRRPLTEVTGPLDSLALADAARAAVAGALLWLVPAGLLAVTGQVTFVRGAGLVALAAGIASMWAAAVLEEFVFRGFVFQRVQAGLGPRVALVGTSLYFVLVHLGNPGMSGGVRVLAGLNIFMAGLAFGLAYQRTGSLLAPIGLHVAANVVQGPLLGFGVSGTGGEGVLAPVTHAPWWLTGGTFGLEASVPGLVAITAVALYFWRRPPART